MVPDGPAAVVVRVAALVVVAAVAEDITLTVLSSGTKCLSVSASVLIKCLARGLRGACVADPLLV